MKMKIDFTCNGSDVAAMRVAYKPDPRARSPLV